MPKGTQRAVRFSYPGKAGGMKYSEPLKAVYECDWPIIFWRG